MEKALLANEGVVANNAYPNVHRLKPSTVPLDQKVLQSRIRRFEILNQIFQHIVPFHCTVFHVIISL